MSCEQQFLVAAHAVDALDDVERVRFESHLRTCEICQVELAEFRLGVTELGADVASEPPPELRRAVLDQIASTPQEAARRDVTGLDQHRRSLHGRPGLLLVTAAAIVLIVGAIGFGFDGGGGLIVDADDAVVAMLEGEPGTIDVVWSAEQGRVQVTGDALVELDPDRAYALWFLLDDGVVPAGLFGAVEGSVDIELDVDDVDGIGFGVTIEPSSGSAQPTTEVIYSAVF